MVASASVAFSMVSVCLHWWRLLLGVAVSPLVAVHLGRGKGLTPRPWPSLVASVSVCLGGGGGGVPRSPLVSRWRWWCGGLHGLGLLLLGVKTVASGGQFLGGGVPPRCASSVVASVWCHFDTTATASVAVWYWWRWRCATVASSSVCLLQCSKLAKFQY